jgi:23S rRNA pseudouridine2605 synthase
MTKKKIDLQPVPSEAELTQPESTEPESTEQKLEASPKIEAEAAVAAAPETAIEAAEEGELQAEDELEGEGVEAESEAEEENEAEREVEAEDGPEPESEVEAEEGSQPESEPKSEDSSESGPSANSKPRPAAKLERLQKILAAAGVASRRSAEAMIEQGRVQVNGKVVTELGTKADAGRDHIRVDGKLLQGAERLRYFVLNKPKGFVTTVKDPEGRPTVMQFFDKMKERLYPVGRLDYMSEGLLVVTNDGDLANRLTKASSGVEKTYLVKVAGQPTEAELDILRGGVWIERGKSGPPQTGLSLRGDKPGSSKVRTSPARIRQVRQGDNPWYEVVLVEGRNRELRKIFEEVGHFVEKIRRVGYGPLVLDQEPGNLRELQPEELERLRLAAEGKLRTPKSKDLRRRNAADAGRLPTVLPKPSGRPRLSNLPSAAPGTMAARFGDDRPKKAFGAERPSRGAAPFVKSGGKPFRPARPGEEGFRPAAGRTSAPNPVRSFSHEEGDRSSRTGAGDSAPFGSARPAGRSFDRVYDRPGGPPAARSSARPAGRPAWKKEEGFPARPTERFAAGPTSAGRPFKAKPAGKKPEGQERTRRPAFKSPAPPRHEARDFDEDLGPVRPPNLHIEEIQAERPSPARSGVRPSSAPRFDSRGPSSSRPNSSRSGVGRPSSPRPYSDRPRPSRSASEEADFPARPGAAKPFRGEGGLPRPFTTSSGKPRAGGARPSSKPGRPAKPGAGRSYGASSRGPASGRPASSARPGSGPRSSGPRSPSSSSSPRPYTPRTEGASDYRPTKAKPYPSSTSRAERKAGPDWKTKPSFGGSGKPASGSRSGSKTGGPRPGGFSKSGFKAKSSSPGVKRTGPRPGGKRPGGVPGGKKRG